MSCSSSPIRSVASQFPLVFGKVDSRFSSIKLYPHEGDQHYERFYLEFRNDKKNPVDVDLSEIKVEGFDGLAFHLKRLSAGRYEILSDREINDYKKIRIEVQGQFLKHSLVKVQKPSKLHSRARLLERLDHLIKVQLVLKDRKGGLVESSNPPELILEGMGSLSEMFYVGKGIWEFYVSYPEENQIFYLSVRSGGVHLERVFRFHHVEENTH